MNFKKDKKGFTLIELLVVIAIIGLLATLAVVALGNAREKSRDAKRVSDVKQVQTALELRYVETEDYPAANDGAGACTGTPASCALGEDVTCLDDVGWNTSCGTPLYMGLVPRDPSASATSVNCTGAVADAVGCEYAYLLVATNDYEIFFELEGSLGGLNDGPHCGSQNGTSNNSPATCP